VTGGGASDLLSLPAGGGAQHGIGETFTPDLHTGTGNASVPIKLPPGRAGLEPQVSLRYSSGGPNGPFGLGWELSVPALTRKTTRGVPRYDRRDTFLLAGVEDLVPVTGAPAGAQRYRPRTESLFALIDHFASGTDHWEVRTKDGRTTLYGTPRPAAAPTTWTDPATVCHPSLGAARTFAWRLTEQRDALGNRISYRYRRDSGQDGPHHWDNLYLQDIRYVEYGAAAARKFLVSVRLVYDDEPDPIDGNTQVERPDPFSDYRGGFEIRTRRRCTWIVVSTHTDDDRRVRAYRLVYLDERDDFADLAEQLPANGLSLLSRVELVGFDDGDEAVHDFPPLEFGYTRFEPARRTFQPLGGEDLPEVSLADPSLDLVDLTGDGLPDLLETNDTVRYWRNKGDGSFDPPRAMDSAPGNARLQDQGIQLLDANGDGRLDLVTTTEAAAGYFSLRPDGAFDRRSFRPYATAPSFSLEDSEVRLVDVDGDGITDAVRSGTRLECFFNDAVLGWTAGATRQVERRSLDQFPNVDFADPRVRFADMSGDGLQDLVLVYDGNVEYWPSLGRGDYGARIHMRQGPRFPYGYDPRRVLLGDVDGDGLADLVYVDNRRVTVWVNRSGNDWSDSVTIHGTPPVTDVDAVRLVDAFGSGVTGVLWSTEPRGWPRQTFFFLDLIGGVKPYLLNMVDNGLGAVTRIGYSTSTRFYVQDHRHRRSRWRSTLPFPVHVVDRVEVIDEVSNGKLTSEFSYHDGYWDGFEREARGFGRVERRDTQESNVYNAPGLHGDAEFVPVTQFSPPVLTKTWFHQGPVADASGEWSESDFVDEFWQVDRQVLQRPQETAQLLGSLPRSARRDALRAMRGSILRTEMYALDGTVLATTPYTVSERISALREESSPTSAEPGRHRIFFPHLVAERTTQWERGTDPLTRIALTGDYDEWGQPCRRTSVALPRRSSLRRPGGVAAGGDDDRILATHTLTEFATPDSGLYLHDRVAHERTFVLAAPPGVTETDPTDVGAVVADQAGAARGVDGTFRTLLNAWQAGDPIPTGLELIGHVVTHYDGAPARAFLGRNPGKVGPYGVVVRTEALAFTSGLLDAAYGAERPAYLGGPASLPAGAPAGFAADLGYRFRQRSADGYHDGYYVDRERMKLDFHVSGATDPRGLTLAIQDPLGREISLGNDPYGYLRTQVTDAAALTTEAKHDYRALQPVLLTDPNGNRTRFAYTPLGLLASMALLGKAGAGEGDSTRASRQFTYDVQSTPISVHTTSFVHHDTEPGLSADQLA
jgi:YD repeat-containing protein